MALRVVGFNPYGRMLNRGTMLQLSETPGRVYELRPNAEGHGWGADVVTNTHGFRDTEWQHERTPGTHRIAVIGDSIAFGNGLPAADAFPNQLEQRLNAAGGSWEVQNYAIGGYDLRQQVATLHHVALPLEPDVVLVAYCMNDIGRASINTQTLERLGGRPHWMMRSRLLQLGFQHYDRYTENRFQTSTSTATYDAEVRPADAQVVRASQAIQRGIAERKAAGSEPDRVLTYYTDPAKLRELRQGMDRLAALRDQHQVRMAVVILPFLTSDKSGLHTKAERIVQHEVEAAGLVAIPVRDDLSRLEIDQLRQEADDLLHFDARGHEAVAQRLFQHLQTKRRKRPRAAPRRSR